jgi:DNA repair ATPase RecN
MIKSKVNYENRLILEGHSLGITDHYERLDVQDNYEEYQKATDLLTINEENRLKKKIKTLEIEKTRLDKLESSLKKLEQKYKKVCNKLQ